MIARHETILSATPPSVVERRQTVVVDLERMGTGTGGADLRPALRALIPEAGSATLPVAMSRADRPKDVGGLIAAIEEAGDHYLVLDDKLRRQEVEIADLTRRADELRTRADEYEALNNTYLARIRDLEIAESAAKANLERLTKAVRSVLHRRFGRTVAGDDERATRDAPE